MLQSVTNSITKPYKTLQNVTDGTDKLHNILNTEYRFTQIPYAVKIYYVGELRLLGVIELMGGIRSNTFPWVKGCFLHQ